MRQCSTCSQTTLNDYDISTLREHNIQTYNPSKKRADMQRKVLKISFDS